ncbi:hypothetical protein EU527_06800 [Candidatus Thorarchaeota archaeon]|nr:MAG: hypothetical protein EU527_06800 [Candidatus Thorarchaeota archaeon]
MTNRKFFDEPIVRIKIGRIRFPKICPVCGAISTTSTWITTTPRRKQWLRPHWKPGFYASERKRLGLTLEEKKSFQVHICENHYISDDGEWRFRILAMLLISITVSLSIFFFIISGNSIWNGGGINPGIRGYFAILLASIVIGYLAFKPNALESAFQIIGFDFDVQYVWLKLKNPDYRAKLVEDNPLNVELVNWIVKV